MVAVPRKLKGLKCSNCGCRHFITLATWPVKKRQAIRRRKACRYCGKEIFTTEAIEDDEGAGKDDGRT